MVIENLESVIDGFWVFFLLCERLVLVVVGSSYPELI